MLAWGARCGHRRQVDLHAGGERHDAAAVELDRRPRRHLQLPSRRRELAGPDIVDEGQPPLVRPVVSLQEREGLRVELEERLARRKGVGGIGGHEDGAVSVGELTERHVFGELDDNVYGIAIRVGTACLSRENNHYSCWKCVDRNSGCEQGVAGRNKILV